MFNGRERTLCPIVIDARLMEMKCDKLPDDDRICFIWINEITLNEIYILMQMRKYFPHKRSS